MQIRIATRQSKLALWQANHVRQQLLIHHPHLDISLVPMITSGDRLQTSSQSSYPSKSMFVKELQIALLNKQADIAVHSIKDLSVSDMPELYLAAICERHDPRDVIISSQQLTLHQLPKGALLGSNSPRRQCQLRALRQDLNIVPLRGNIDTRLQRLLQGDFAAIILAAAGLARLKLQQYITEYLEPTHFVPAIGQGAIGIECRVDDNLMRELLAPLDHAMTRYCVMAERAVNKRLNGDCYTPLGAYARPIAEQLVLQGMVGSLDGKCIIQATQTGPISQPEALGYQLAEQLLAQGAASVLAASSKYSH